MKPERIVLTEHGELRRYVYRFPCGTLTYNGHRKHHDWRVGEQSFGEDRMAACTVANERGLHSVLYLDGVRVGS